MITLINRQRKVPLDEHWVHSVIQELLLRTGHSSSDVGILCTTNRTIALYNKKFRNKKGPTDILSFSYADHTDKHHAENGSASPEELGDLILSLEYIEASSKKQGVSFEHQLLILIIHGICHLLGYDHELDEDYARMQALEDQLLADLPSSLRR
jgi:rRNA maturation RNase YbeY